MQGSPHLSTREREVIPPSDASVRRSAVLHTCPPAPGRAGDRHHGKGRALPAFPSSHEVSSASLSIACVLNAPCFGKVIYRLSK